jgi:transposase
MPGVKAMSCFVGIDVAAKTVDVVVRKQDRNQPVQTFAQDHQGRSRLVARLVALKPSLIVLEATGVYYLDLAQALHQAGLPVAVINPRSFHHFARLKMATSKTDCLDAALLAEYAQRMAPRRWTPPDAERMALRDIGRQINRLVGVRTQAKNRLHALQAKQSTPGLLVADEQEGIATLDRRIERLRAAALALVQAHELMAAELRCLTAATGVSAVSALSILGEIGVLPEHLKAAQVSRFAGLDVRLNQSGTSLNRPGRLSKAGNAYLRSALFMPAMAAVRHDPHAKAFYDALVSRGKKRIQAICAVMRKYLTGLWACLRTQTPFDSKKLFSPIHKGA